MFTYHPIFKSVLRRQRHQWVLTEQVLQFVLGCGIGGKYSNRMSLYINTIFIYINISSINLLLDRF